MMGGIKRGAGVVAVKSYCTNSLITRDLDSLISQLNIEIERA